jgi:hypothetical protein
MRMKNLAADDADLARAAEAIRARRVELLGLARNEAAVVTGRWYALTRISQELTGMVTSAAIRTRAA